MTDVLRCDLLPHAMNKAKEQAVLDLLRAWRSGAVALGREQWRLFFETGRTNKNQDKQRFVRIIGAANRVQMCRWQVVGVLKSWLGNRANEFADRVRCSSLPETIKHQLHVVNRCEAWFDRRNLVMRGTGEVIPDEVRALARSIMRHVMARHRRPDLSRIPMQIDQRAATLAPAAKASAFPLWLRLSTMVKGQRIEVPLTTYPHFERRQGVRALTIQVGRCRDSGTLRFGVVTDITAACAASRAAYQPLRPQVALDFGLATLFASDEGDLLGRGWLVALKRHDRLITGIARHVQRSGGKPKDSRRYRAATACLA